MAKSIRVEVKLVDDKKAATGGRFKGQKRTDKLVLTQVSKGGVKLTEEDFSEKSMYVYEKLAVKGLKSVPINKRNKPGTVWHELMTKLNPGALAYINEGELPNTEPELEVEEQAQEPSIGEMIQDQRLKAMSTELTRKGYKIVAV